MVDEACCDTMVDEAFCKTLVDEPVVIQRWTRPLIEAMQRPWTKLTNVISKIMTIYMRWLVAMG
jgi:hypothetical protein